MTIFSDRNNIRPELPSNMVSDSLKRRILLVIRKCELEHENGSSDFWTSGYGYSRYQFSETSIEQIMYEFGIEYETTPSNSHELNYNTLSDFIMHNSEWFKIYDVIELYLECVDRSKKDLVVEFDRILQTERTQYRILDYKVVPKLDDIEVESIKNAQTTPFDSVNQLLKSALQLFSDRQNPDYRNSIKDSISAVEAMCCHITGNNDVLGKNISLLEKAGIKLPGALISAFKSLYGYTSEAGGIRHGNMKFDNPQIEDARFMLVICSAFVNYLSEKYKLISDK